MTVGLHNSSILLCVRNWWFVGHMRYFWFVVYLWLGDVFGYIMLRLVVYVACCVSFCIWLEEARDIPEVESGNWTRDFSHECKWFGLMRYRGFFSDGDCYIIQLFEIWWHSTKGEWAYDIEQKYSVCGRSKFLQHPGLCMRSSLAPINIS